MIDLKKYISRLILLCSVLFAAGCTDEAALLDPSSQDGQQGDVTLSLRVSVGNTQGTGTRAEDFNTQPTKIAQELINTLRIIIVRQDSTVEYNRKEVFDGVGLQTVGALDFLVSTSLGEVKFDARDNKYYRTEKKHIYLIANEECIPDAPEGDVDVKKELQNLKPGYYRKPAPSESDNNIGDSESEEEGETKVEPRDEWVPGDVFLPSTAESFLIWNKWDVPEGNTLPEYASPILNNEGETKKFVLMSEFFDIEVTSNLSEGYQKDVQQEDLFITRNFVKFQYTITATEETSSFQIKQIRFENLMQKEYLFPNHCEYNPPKYEAGKVVNVEKREIISYNTPPKQDPIINLTRPYIFTPANFGWNGRAYPADEPTKFDTYYNPLLYFCETQNFVSNGSGQQVFSMWIDVEYPFTEEVLDKDGKPVTQPATATYGPVELTNLSSLPRNTIVQVNMELGNGELKVEAIEAPYNSVTLNPDFGELYYPEEEDE